ncbi:EamA family transporter RarD [uncultured Bradyrhizobium sp.]|uniref:EamA family transporter RarD n=1 Tax=uncultured Bradyrhizobium sp. TaxID=199684 RepID=UPI0035CC5684
MNDHENTTSKGIFSATFAYFFWGVSALYWRLLGAVSAPELLAYRILLSLIVLLAILLLAGNLGSTIREAAVPRNALIYSLSGISIAVNWSAFIWGSIHGQVVETGLGYLIAPLLSVACGTIFLRERLTRAKSVAVLIMIAAVFLLIIRSAELNVWVYAAIALSFGCYSILRKLGPLGAVPGLAVETAVLAAAILIASSLGLISFSYPLTAPNGQVAILLACGVVSIIPLWLFSVANRALPLSTLGFFQYILPTTQFILAVTFYKQVLSTNTVASLVLIWVALGIVLIEAARTHRRRSSSLAGVAVPSEV